MKVARLTLFLPLQPPAAHELDAARRYDVGRDLDCAIVCVDERVSRRHAALRHDGNGWLVEDLDSKNGTLVDGLPVAGARRLGERSWLSFGGVLGEFAEESEESRRDAAAGRLRRWTTSARGLTRLGRAGGLAAVVEHLLESLLDLAGMERGYVVLSGPGGELEVTATRGTGPEAPAAEAFAGSTSVVRQVVASGRPMVSATVAASGTLAARRSVAEGGIHALVCLPLGALGGTLGAVYADSQTAQTRLGELDLEILEALTSHAALAIALARLEEKLSAVAATMRERATLSGEEGRDLVDAVFAEALGVSRVGAERTR